MWKFYTVKLSMYSFILIAWSRVLSSNDLPVGNILVLFDTFKLYFMSWIFFLKIKEEISEVYKHSNYMLKHFCTHVYLYFKYSSHSWEHIQLQCLWYVLMIPGSWYVHLKYKVKMFESWFITFIIHSLTIISLKTTLHAAYKY